MSFKEEELMHVVLKETVEYPGFSETLNRPLTEELRRDAVIQSILDSFDERSTIVMIEGESNSGKSTLLSQFVRAFPEKTVSFFIGSDYWKSNLNYFFKDMSKQMLNLVSKKTKERLKNIDLDQLNKERLLTVFNTLYTDICTQSRKGKGPFYFVIDGLDKITKTDTETIKTYLPEGDIDGVYVLLSSTKDVIGEYNFDYRPFKIPNFSMLETSHLFKEYLNHTEIESIFEACKGFPGYVGEIRRQLKLNKYSKSEILNNLPKEFETYLERIWLGIKKSEDELLDFFALITYSPEQLSIEDCISILESNEEKISSYCDEFSIIEINERKLEFIPAFKKFFDLKLEPFKFEAQQRLISFYEGNIQSKRDVMLYLPELYREQNDYEKLKNLITPELLSQTLKKTNEMSIIRKNLRLLSNMANESEDWNMLSSSLLIESVFTKISNSPPSIENEVRALLSLSKYEEALSIIYTYSLAEDNVFLLSLVCRTMKEKGVEVSNDLLMEIENSMKLIDTTVEISEDFIDKIVNICSNLFPINAEKSLELLKNVTSKAGEHIVKEKLMDYMILKLIIKVENESDSDSVDFSIIKDEIESDNLNDFLKITTQSFDDNNINSLFQLVESLNDVSAKLFYLINWCENNIGSKELLKVADYILDLMLKSDEYTPTLRQLRKIATTLKSSEESVNLSNTIKKIELISATLLKNPIEENVRLEIELSKIVYKSDKNVAQERFINTLIDIDKVNDFDLRCISYVYLMLSHDDFFEDDYFYKEIKKHLTIDFNTLLKNSAEHYTVTKKIFFNLQKIEKELSLVFASKMNTEFRKFKAYQEIVKSHIKDKNVDFEYLTRILSNLRDPAHTELLIFNITKEIAKNKIVVPIEIMNVLYGKIINIKSIDLQLMSLSFFMQWADVKNDKIELVYKNIIKNLQLISESELKDRIGMLLVRNLSENFEDKSEALYNLLVTSRQEDFSSDTRLASIYNNIIQITIRMVPDLLKSKSAAFSIKSICSLIRNVNSPYEKALLLSDLSLRIIRENNIEIVKPIVEDYLDIIDMSSIDYNTFVKIVVDTGALLYIEDNEHFFNLLPKINSYEHRDRTILNVIRYLISKRPISDELDFNKLNQKIDYTTAIQVCNLIQHLDKDINIYYAISALIDSIIEIQNTKSTLRERHLLIIAEEINRLIENKLPDSNNIRHDGYKIAARACLIKLKGIKVKAQHQWDTIVPKSEDLVNLIKSIPNVSDRIFVFTLMGKKLSNSNTILANNVVKEAESYLGELNNQIDRMSRYESIAEAYKAQSNEKAATYILEQAIDIAKACTYENNRDVALGSLIEIAHNISPELAQSYASSLESSNGHLHLIDKVNVLNLHSNPKRINNNNSHNENILHDFFKRTLQSICSERGTIQHNDVIGKALYNSMGDSFETIMVGVNWFIENEILSNKSLNDSKLNELFVNILSLANFVHHIKKIILNTQIDGMDDMKDFYIKNATDSSIKAFEPGAKGIAKKFILNWIEGNTQGHLIIHDPYFNCFQLEYIKNIKDDIMISIYSSATLSEWVDLEKNYSIHWQQICDHSPPNTKFYFLCSPSGETPLHDRFIISENNGIKLGTSLNGLESNFSTIEELDSKAIEEIQRQIIFPIMFAPPREHKGQPLILKHFEWGK